MKIQIGDGVTYIAELLLIRGEYKKLYKMGHGYIAQIVNNDLFYVWNGVRFALVQKIDIIQH